MDIELKLQAELEAVESIKQAIRNVGLRATPARIATLQLLRESNRPLTHADVAQHVAPAGIDKATVFRNLNDMSDAGLVHRTELGDHVWRFEALDPTHASGGIHPHFLCTQCGQVTCLSGVKLDSCESENGNKIGQVNEILLRGRCTDCVEDR